MDVYEGRKFEDEFQEDIFRLTCIIQMEKKVMETAVYGKLPRILIDIPYMMFDSKTY